MSAGLNELYIARYRYDFSELGGTVGAIVLPAKVAGLEAGSVITGVHVHTVVAVTSGGTPTITVGPGASGTATDADGYFTDLFGVVGTINGVTNSESNGGALLFDDTNDHKIDYYVTSANTQVIATVGTAALTAGVVDFYIKYYKAF